MSPSPMHALILSACLLGAAQGLAVRASNTAGNATWAADGSLVGGGAKADNVLVADPASAKVTNSLATQCCDNTSGHGQDNTHIGHCGPASSFPAQSDWMDFQDMFNDNKQSMANNGATDQEIGWIYDNIQSVATSSLVDHRLILAIIMQESHGNPRVGSTDSHDGVGNPGLMQSHQGTTCYGVTPPCPSNTIHQMIVDGTQGTSTGDGLVQGINDYGDFYKAARYYNSGNVPDDMCDGTGATNSYVQDVASRMQGWVN